MITIFYPPYSFGGDAIYLYRLCTELVRRGHEVDVIHDADSFHMFGAKADPKAFPVSEGMTIHKLESGVGVLAPLLAHQTGRPVLTGGKIALILASKKFDVVHFHNASLFGPRIMEIEPSYTTVKLYTAHDHWLVCPTNVLWKNRSHACDEPTCLSCMLISRRPPQWWRYTGMMERSSRGVDQFLAPSRFCADMHHARGFTRPIEVLNYFLPPFEDDPSEAAPAPHPRPYFLFVGRLEDYKGVQDLIPHFQGPGDYDLVVVGTGNYESELRGQAEGVERVHFAGWVAQADIGPYYRHALAALVPSTTFETFGIIVIEAYARGVPVIVRDLGALPEVVREGRGGLVFGSPAELGSHLERVASDENFRRELGETGHRSYLEKWTPDSHIHRYEEIIERVRRAKSA